MIDQNELNRRDFLRLSGYQPVLASSWWPVARAPEGVRRSGSAQRRRRSSSQ